MKNLKLIFLILLILFSGKIKGQETDNYSYLKKSQIFFSDPYANYLFPLSPFFAESEGSYSYLYIGINHYNPLLQEILDSLFINTKKIKSGKIIKDQASNGRLLIVLNYINPKDSIFIDYQIFFTLDGNYLLNDSEIEYGREENMIKFIRNRFLVAKI